MGEVAKRFTPTRPAKEEEEEDDFDDDDEEEDEKPKKKAKKEKTPEEKAEKNFLCETASGSECPKKIKDLQQRSMTRSKFMSSAPEMELNIWGNKLIGKPRSFSSDNMGWYTGGKVEVEVDGKVIWGSIGINLTIMGSKDWKK